MSSHRARLMKESDWVKPWKESARRLTGKYVKCPTCEEGSKRVPYGVKDRRMNKVIDEIE
jgi:hypothetical protein